MHNTHVKECLGVKFNKVLTWVNLLLWLYPGEEGAALLLHQHLWQVHTCTHMKWVLVLYLSIPNYNSCMSSSGDSPYKFTQGSSVCRMMSYFLPNNRFLVSNSRIYCARKGERPSINPEWHIHVKMPLERRWITHKASICSLPYECCHRFSDKDEMSESWACERVGPLPSCR